MAKRSTRRASGSTALAAHVLHHQAAWRVLGNWESRLLASRLAATTIDRPVFISGLARAGTTILLRKLCELPEFATHRYSDFPFLFTPYAWALLRRLMPASRQIPRERMHQDGIMVTAESPEAMEEVLWMAFFPRLHDPEVSNVLDDRVRRPEFESFFTEHIRKLILARGGQRYVSKNNYNVTRLSYLARLFPDARFLLPIRSPHAHVGSLMKQHRLFCQIQHENEAARRHLHLVGHFEFGLDRRPINPGDRRRRSRDRGLLGARRGSSGLGEVLGAHVPSPRRSARSRSRGRPPHPGGPLRGIVRSGAGSDDSSMRTHRRVCRPGRGSCCRTAPARLLHRPIHRCGVQRHHRRDVCSGRSLRLSFH